MAWEIELGAIGGAREVLVCVKGWVAAPAAVADGVAPYALCFVGACAICLGRGFRACRASYGFDRVAGILTMMVVRGMA